MYIELQGRFLQKEEFEVKCDIRSVSGLVPDGFQIDRTGYRTSWNILQCKIANLRPAGLPEWTGITFNLTSYRLPVKTITEESVHLHGLFSVHSESNFHPIEALQKAVPELAISSLSNIPFLSMTKKNSANSQLPLLSVDRSGWIISTRFVPSNDSEFFLRSGGKEGRIVRRISKTLQATSSVQDR